MQAAILAGENQPPDNPSTYAVTLGIGKSEF